MGDYKLDKNGVEQLGYGGDGSRDKEGDYWLIVIGFCLIIIFLILFTVALFL